MLSCFSRVPLFATLWTVAHQASLSMGFSRQEYWSGLPCPPPGNLPYPGIEPGFPALQVDSLLSESWEKPYGSMHESKIQERGQVWCLLFGNLLSSGSSSNWKSESIVTQLCPTLCDPMDCSPPGFSIHGIFQARILEWVAISFSRRSSGPRDWTQVSQIAGRLFTVWVTRESELVLYSEVKVFSWWKLLTLGLLNSENKSSE